MSFKKKKGVPKPSSIKIPYRRPVVSDMVASPTGVQETPAARVGRYRMNGARDGRFISDLYRRYYDPTKGGARVDLDDDTLSDVYRLMGVGGPGYLARPVTRRQVEDLIVAGEGRWEVENQSGGPFSAALAAGDYFRVRNRSHPEPKDMRYRARRLVVNVQNQQTALAIGNALAPLFADPDIGPRFYQFKMYLSNWADPQRNVKHDKMVVYYAIDPTSGGDDDVIGDELVRTISAAIPPGEAGQSVSPFYSIITPGVAWAEEAEDYLPDSGGRSFTETRAAVIARVLADNPKVTGQKQLADLITAALTKEGVVEGARHRHEIPDKI
ncbi:T3SS effector HopA1 family protein [Herbidospora daliensis]|uniref:T3SS effector HopA1 family protein n=1 Tax=Herbidospora daliensis TaxID=295585 RepID=UPI0007824AAD|nr:T3SS effector HopA1 family protein [Herbidospora daliensis]